MTSDDDLWQRDVTVLRGRAWHALGPAGTVLVLVLLLGSLTGQAFAIFFVIMLVGLLGVLAFAAVRLRSRRLILSAAGIERRTRTYRVRVPWSAVTRLRQDRAGAFGTSWTLEHRPCDVEGPEGGDPGLVGARDAMTARAGDRIGLDGFLRDPRSGPLGRYLAEHRPDL